MIAPVGWGIGEWSNRDIWIVPVYQPTAYMDSEFTEGARKTAWAADQGGCIRTEGDPDGGGWTVLPRYCSGSQAQ